MDFKIHIFCGTSYLCKLIRKTFVREPYTFNCTEVTDKLNDKSGKLDYTPDCIIFDKDIAGDFKEEIINKHSDSSIILLPSLNEIEALANSKNVFQISEPFKLSELSEVLKEIYHNKQIEESIN
ncbi:MAG: hypothetical protein HY959_11035 [Ignavibacteriae bacterium]|nr:hypothetical protein [Ignavibacteriota bacterium]